MDTAGAHNSRSTVIFSLTLLFFAGLTYLCRHHVFFWDTVQFAGKHGLWFYEQDFQTWLLPPEIDSGHPPVFGWYLAMVWKIFGQSLAVSHWAMFPFLFGIVWQLYRLGHHVLRNVAPYWIILIPLADPVFLGQSMLVSPDIALCFFFLLAVRAYWQKKTWWGLWAYLGLSLISMRGMMVVSAFALLEAWRWARDMRRHAQFLSPSWLPVFLPAGLFSLIFMIIHYHTYGWIGYHPDSPWAPSFIRVDLRGLGRNMVILLWRWLDLGRIVLWITLVFLLIVDRIKTGRTVRSYYLRVKTSSLTDFFLLLFFLVLLLSYSFLTYSGLQAHRYLLPVFLLFSIIVVLVIDRLPRKGLRRPLMLIVLVGLLSGNFWKYPDQTAQGWDSTMAHWPYYELRQAMLTYLQEEDIDLETVGTAFPEIGALKWRDLSGRTDGFKAKDLSKDRYILYSNVMNDFSDAECAILEENWIAVRRLEKWPVKMILYERK